MVQCILKNGLEQVLRPILLLWILVLAAACTGNRATIPTDTFFDALHQEPESLNPMTAKDGYSAEVFKLTFDALLELNPETYEWMPGLAEKWDVSPDGLSFTFYLRHNAVFHDGQPITAQDVKFSFDSLFDERFKATIRRALMENFAKCEAVDNFTVRFVAKTKIFSNLEHINELAILPQHVYGDPVKKPDMIVGSGPYKMVEYNRGKNILLHRNPQWWGFQVDAFKNKHSYKKIYYRFVGPENLKLEMLKKGDLDFDVLSPEAFTVKAVGDPWDKTIKKVQAENDAPTGYGFIAWNLKNPLFSDKNVRVALTHLMNRQLMIEKFTYGKSTLATGPWYRRSPFADPEVKPIEFNPKKAAELLAAAGFKDSDHSGVLAKMVNGKKLEFRFTLLNTNHDFEKYFTIYQEDLKKAGILMDIKTVEWNSFLKELDDRKFESLAMAWGPGGLDEDPQQIWHSKSAAPGGSNFVSYINPQADRLIDQALGELNREKRIPILRKLYKMIADDAPYIFLFNPKYSLYALNTRVKQDKPTFRYLLGKAYWRLEP